MGCAHSVPEEQLVTKEVNAPAEIPNPLRVSQESPAHSKADAVRKSTDLGSQPPQPDSSTRALPAKNAGITGDKAKVDVQHSTRNQHHATDLSDAERSKSTSAAAPLARPQPGHQNAAQTQASGVSTPHSPQLQAQQPTSASHTPARSLLDSTDATADVHSSMHEPPPFQVDGSGSAYPGVWAPHLAAIANPGGAAPEQQLAGASSIPTSAGSGALGLGLASLPPPAVPAVGAGLASGTGTSSVMSALRGHRYSRASSTFSRASSVAMLLGVEEFAAADIEPPEETGLLPLGTFDGMTTEEFEAALAEQGQSNLLFLSPRTPPGMLRPRWSLEDYVLLKHMHQGYIADVVDARCKASGHRAALKVYSLPEMPELERVQLLREIRLHGRLDHPNIVTLYAAFMEQGIHTSQLGRAKYNHVVLVEEFAEGGDLLAMMMRHGGRLTELVAVNDVLRPLLTVLAHLHVQGIVHRDLKPGNVLFTATRQMKLADFGLALDLNEERANTRAGTLEFMAPEVLACPAKRKPNENKERGVAGGQGPGREYTMTADVWAAGALLYSIICGHPPFRGANNKEVARKILKSEASQELVFPDRMSSLSREFVLSCMAREPGDRPTVLELLEHPLLALTRSTPSSNTGSPAQSRRVSQAVPASPKGLVSAVPGAGVGAVGGAPAGPSPAVQPAGLNVGPGAAAALQHLGVPLHLLPDGTPVVIPPAGPTVQGNAYTAGVPPQVLAAPGTYLPPQPVLFGTVGAHVPHPHATGAIMYQGTGPQGVAAGTAGSYDSAMVLQQGLTGLHGTGMNYTAGLLPVMVPGSSPASGAPAGFDMAVLASALPAIEGQLRALASPPGSIYSPGPPVTTPAAMSGAAAAALAASAHAPAASAMAHGHQYTQAQ